MRAATSLLLCFAALGSVAAAALEAPAPPARHCVMLCPADEAWRELAFDGAAPNRYRCAAGELVVKSESSVSLLTLPAPEGFEAARALSWEWAVDDGAPATPLDRKGADDRSLVVLVAFEGAGAEGSWMDRLRRLAAGDAPDHALAYTWGGAAPAGAVIDSPFGGPRHKILVLQPADPSAETGAFRAERVSIAEDHARLFGEGPYRIQHLAIGADTDDSASSAMARLRRLCFWR